MKIIRDYRNCSHILQGQVVALGNFDGVHKGHDAVIRQAVQIAEASGIKVSVLTFEPHPLSILKPGCEPFRLTTWEQKASLIQELGVHNLFVINFTQEFSGIKAGDFIREVLVSGLAASHVVTGENFIFGHNREGSAALIADMAHEYNFGYTKVLSVGDDGEIFSSSAIRTKLIEGKPTEARAMMGRHFRIEGVVEEGRKQGRAIGLPTINISLGDYIRPALGVYAVRVYVEGRPGWLAGAANIGIRPTFGGDTEVLEVHILDFSGNLYGNTVTVELMEYIRPERSFSHIDELKEQIMEDCISVRTVFGDGLLC